MGYEIGQPYRLPTREELKQVLAERQKGGRDENYCPLWPKLYGSMSASVSAAFTGPRPWKFDKWHEYTMVELWRIWRGCPPPMYPDEYVEMINTITKQERGLAFHCSIYVHHTRLCVLTRFSGIGHGLMTVHDPKFCPRCGESMVKVALQAPFLFTWGLMKAIYRDILK